MLDLIAVLHRQPIVSYLFKFLGRPKCLQRQQQEIIIDVTKSAPVVATIRKHNRLLTCIGVVVFHLFHFDLLGIVVNSPDWFLVFIEGILVGAENCVKICL